MKHRLEVLVSRLDSFLVEVEADTPTKAEAIVGAMNRQKLEPRLEYGGTDEWGVELITYREEVVDNISALEKRLAEPEEEIK